MNLKGYTINDTIKGRWEGGKYKLLMQHKEAEEKVEEEEEAVEEEEEVKKCLIQK